MACERVIVLGSKDLKMKVFVVWDIDSLVEE